MSNLFYFAVNDKSHICEILVDSFPTKCMILMWILVIDGESMSKLYRNLHTKILWRNSIIFLAALLILFVYRIPETVTQESPAGEQQQTTAEEPWTFVSFPDFFNFDVPNPWPGWDDAVDWYLNQVKSENPDFVLIAGDLVNGHWWDGPKCIEQMAALYYPGWIRRMQKHGLNYYVAVGDHELGDDPWPKEKLELVPHFEQVFARHLRMPDNGPQNKKGLAYYVLHKNILLITVETFELQDGKLHMNVLGEQLEWLKNVLAEHKNVKHIIVQGHVPIFGHPESRSSSELMLEGAKTSQFWQTMKEAGVDLYLCGEFHAVTAAESDGIWQIVHGSSWGREIVNTQDYLVCTVFPDSLHLEMKSLPLQAKGDYMWNLHKDKGPREIVEIPQHARQQGPKTTGTLLIQKSESGKKYLGRTGVFQ